MAVGGILYCVGKIIAVLAESSSNQDSRPRLVPSRYLLVFEARVPWSE